MNRLFRLEPLTVKTLRHGEHIFISIDAALLALGKTVTPGELATALADAGVVVSLKTIYRWRTELQNETA